MAASETSASVRVRKDGSVTIVAIARPEVRNAVDRHTAEALAEAFRAFDADPGAAVAILTGEGGTFCAGADLKAVAAGDPNRFAPDGDAPMGVSRLRLSKPVVAAISGHAVAGGLELALWADLRVADEDAVLGVFCRRWGVPLIDGGTVRLPRLIGGGHAMDLILTGRPVYAEEALRIGLINRITPPGQALDHALTLAHELTRFPQTCLRHDRLSALEQEGLTETAALANEHEHGAISLIADTVAGATRFADGAGRHGSFADLGTTTTEEGTPR
ncbi:crotonase/enoyl-CoA hydratase family protein [Nocardia asteroides]|uniref:crotonase/enoyl-CoA hydratase family protein n=1 Tax=Nocardia asteroides TaxID=1824 RepID=UPI0034009E80